MNRLANKLQLKIKDSAEGVSKNATDNYTRCDAASGCERRDADSG